MPRSSTLGDHHTGNHTHRGTYPPTSSTSDVSIAVREDDPDENRGRLIDRLLTVGTCLLLIGSGIGVGIWAAM